MPNELCQRCDKEMANMDGSTFCIFKFLLRENHRIADELGSINKFWKEQRTNCTHCLTMRSRKKQGKTFRRNYIMGYINSTIDETSSSTRSHKAHRVGPWGPEGPHGTQGGTRSQRWYRPRGTSRTKRLYRGTGSQRWGKITGGPALRGETGAQGPKDGTGSQGPKGDTGQ